MRKIDVHRDHLVPLSHYVQIRPPGRNGKAMHIGTGYRHAHKGVKGEKLSTVNFGGVVCTSLEAIQEFVDFLSGGSSNPSRPSDPQPPTTPGEAEAVARADRLFA